MTLKQDKELVKLAAVPLRGGEKGSHQQRLQVERKMVPTRLETLDFPFYLGHCSTCVTKVFVKTCCFDLSNLPAGSESRAVAVCAQLCGVPCS